MKLSSMIQEDLVIFNCNITTKDNGIKEILSQFKKYYRDNIDYDFIYEKILEREELGSTTYDNGLTIPHTRIDSIDDVVIGVLIPSKPFLDNGTEVSMIILILSSTSTSSLYLNVLSAISKQFSTIDKIKSYTKHSTHAGFISELKTNDTTINSEILVKNIINSEFTSITPNDSIEHAINAMSKFEIPFLPVCDENNIYLGCLHFHDIISIGIPQYAQMLTSMKFISHIEPMEQLFKNEKEIKVSDVMNKKETILQHDEYLVEAIMLMNKERKLFLPVLQDKKCIGVLSYNSIINNYLRV